MKSWTMLWEKFKIRYKLEEEIEKIHIFVEMKHYKDFADFVPVKSPKFDSIPGSGGNYEDSLLPYLEKYDSFQEICSKVVDIFLKLSNEMQILFDQIFIKNMEINKIRLLTNNPFVFEDVLVTFASNDDEVEGHEMIIDEYIALKEKYLKDMKKIKKFILTDGELAKHPFLEQLVLSKHNGNNWRRIQLEILKIMFKEEFIDNYDFELFASMKCGGKKLIRDLKKNQFLP